MSNWHIRTERMVVFFIGMNDLKPFDTVLGSHDLIYNFATIFGHLLTNRTRFFESTTSKYDRA